jgi:hypothetical protein
MITPVDIASDPQAARAETPAERTLGPLFKELYTGLIDVEDPSVWGPVLAGETRSLLAHTTDIQTLAQFHSLHQVPKKSGTAYHHKTYLNTVEHLKA